MQLNKTMKQALVACKKTLIEEFVVAIKNCYIKKINVVKNVTIFVFHNRPDARQIHIVMDNRAQCVFSSDDEDSVTQWLELQDRICK